MEKPRHVISKLLIHFNFPGLSFLPLPRDTELCLWKPRWRACSNWRILSHFKACQHNTENPSCLRILNRQDAFMIYKWNSFAIHLKDRATMQNTLLTWGKRSAFLFLGCHGKASTDVCAAAALTDSFTGGPITELLQRRDLRVSVTQRVSEQESTAAAEPPLSSCNSSASGLRIRLSSSQYLNTS